ncbi:Universal stress protein A like protein [Saliniradius amylolyticus]|uniref:Universal stress protein n=1 Tax=Saliniradius amylolyticus TaxID=2183582 RepID=A0A2S2E792_9ALTE|nr:universal stress protein [Saliniradius amylolyticus]AWL13402.1 Universal stress protein A like protein [Saliniradius amylolyticus]
MYNNVLVAIDTSVEAKQVLDAVFANESIKGSKLHIFHATELPSPGMGDYAGYDFAFDMESVLDTARKSVKSLIEPYGLGEDDFSIQSGHASDLIVDTAEERNADLIVLGSHGRHGIRLLLGSTANSVLHHAKCDVLAVRIKD